MKDLAGYSNTYKASDYTAIKTCIKFMDSILIKIFIFLQEI